MFNVECNVEKPPYFGTHKYTKNVKIFCGYEYSAYFLYIQTGGKPLADRKEKTKILPAMQEQTEPF